MRRVMVLMLVLPMLLLPVGASANDTPAAEITAAYSYLYDDSLADSDLGGSLGLGWTAALNINLNRSVGVLFDVSGAYKSDSLGDVSIYSLNVYGFHGGLRFSARNETFTVYGQALAGVTRGSAALFGEGVGSDTNFSVQPGVGFHVKLSKVVGIDAGGDYRLIFAEGEKVNELRAHGGLVFYLGGK